MASNLDLQEQEQLAEFKAWWNRWSNLILTGATVVLLCIAAWNGWNWYKRSQASEAAAQFAQIQQGLQDKDNKRVRDAAGEILQKYPSSAYAPLAAMISAKVHFDAGDLKTARAQLQWVVDNAKDPELQSIGRLRLANVMIDEKAYDEAVKLVGERMDKPFLPLAASLRGDIFALQGKKPEARSAYREALEKADTKDTTLRDRVQLKLDALGEG